MSILQALNGNRVLLPDADFDWVQYFHERLNNDNHSVSLDRAKVAGMVLAHERALEELATLRRMAGQGLTPR